MWFHGMLHICVVQVSELVAKITQLESDNWQLTKERQYYCSLVESSKTNLIDLKKR